MSLVTVIHGGPEQSQTRLIGAQTFAMGGVGIAGTITPEETALREILTQSDAVARCQIIIKRGTLSGQLYGLLGLKLKDDAAFQAALKDYKGSKTMVPSMSGCIMEKVTVGEIAAGIEKGVWK